MPDTFVAYHSDSAHPRAREPGGPACLGAAGRSAAEIRGMGEWPSVQGGPRAWAAGARALGRGDAGKGAGPGGSRSVERGDCRPIVSAASDDQKSLKEGVQ